jgi:hypothetical protein
MADFNFFFKMAQAKKIDFRNSLHLLDILS